MLSKFNENMMMDIDFKYPFSVQVKTNEISKEYCKSIYIVAKANDREFNIFDCYVSPINEEKVNLLNDILSHVSKVLLNKVSNAVFSSKNAINLVSTIDEIIANDISTEDKEVLQKCYSLAYAIKKDLRMHGFTEENFNDYCISHSVIVKSCIDTYNGGKENAF